MVVRMEDTCHSREKVPFLLYDSSTIPNASGLSRSTYYKLPLRSRNVTQRFQAIADDSTKPIPSSIALCLTKHMAHSGLQRYIQRLIDICADFRCPYLVVGIPAETTNASTVMDIRNSQSNILYGKICVVDVYRFANTEKKAASHLLQIANICMHNDTLGGGLERPGISPTPSFKKQTPQISTSPTQSDIVPVEENPYRALVTRFQRQKKLYALAAERLARKDFFIFTIPLLILQIANAVVPSFINVSGSTAEVERLARIQETLTVVISSISAAIIATHGKLRWSTRSEKFSNIASGYSLLAGEAYCKMMQWTMMRDYVSLEEASQAFVQFVEYTNKLEKNGTAGAPLPPSRLERVILRKEEQLLASLNEPDFLVL